MKIITILIIIFCFVSVSNSQYWEKVNGVHTFVHNFFNPENDQNLLVVMSDSIPIDFSQKDLFPSIYSQLTGIGISISYDGGRNFTYQNAMDSTIVTSMISSDTDPNLWIASVSDRNIGKIATSTDQGKNWSFNSECFGTKKIINLISDGSKLYGGAVSTASGLLTSTDNFTICETVEEVNASIRDIKYLNNKIWFCSDNTAISGVYSSDDGKIFNKDNSGLSGLRILCVDVNTYQDKNFEYAVCGADKQTGSVFIGQGIYGSRDGGNNWDLVGGENMIVYDIEHHPKYPLLFVAACGTDGILISTDGGFTWKKEYNEGLPTNSDIRKVFIPNWDLIDGGYQIFVGVNNSGLYRSKSINPVLLNIDDEMDNNSLNIFPNPVVDNINLTFNSEISSIYDLEIINSIGEEVFSQSIHFSVGINNFNLDFKNKEKGIYILKLTNSKETITKKFIH